MSLTSGPANVVAEVVPHAVSLRRDLHRHPELGYEEHRTSGVVRRELEELGISYVDGLAGGTGVLGYLPATSDPGSAATIALRADMDALPIRESSGVPHASETDGVMHACGHDGHTATLLGVARALAGERERVNNVKFVFQPAEEGGAGGDRMCRDGVLGDGVLGGRVDQIYGLHGWPELEVGKVATRPGPLLAATDEFDIEVRGVGGHAAYPHLCVDPVLAGASVVQALQSVASRTISPLDSVVVTVGEFHAGYARNVIPGTALLRGTLRTLRDETRRTARARLEEIAARAASALGCEATLAWDHGYPVTRNDAGATARFRAVAGEVLGGGCVLEREHPSMGGEDFSFYGQHVPACFFFVGLKPAGAERFPNLHTPEFDYNDDAISVGVSVFRALALAPLR